MEAILFWSQLPQSCLLIWDMSTFFFIETQLLLISLWMFFTCCKTFFFF